MKEEKIFKANWYKSLHEGELTECWGSFITSQVGLCLRLYKSSRERLSSAVPIISTRVYGSFHAGCSSYTSTSPGWLPFTFRGHNSRLKPLALKIYDYITHFFYTVGIARNLPCNFPYFSYNKGNSSKE